MALSILPAYESRPHTPPNYTREPLENEQTVAFSPRPGTATPCSGVYIKSFREATVIFNDQREGVEIPTYTRGATVSGEIGLSCPHEVVQVTVKLYGQMSLMAAEYGSAGATLVSERHILWDKHTNVEHNKHCPSIVPFAIGFPTTYTSPDGKALRLPPSYETSFFGIPSFFAKCIYLLTITIVKMRRYRVGSWTASKAFNIFLNYRPRTRPQRPVLRVDSIFLSLKPVPEEWLQLIATLETRSGSNATPVECHLLIPSVLVFAIADPIPFHIQICSSLASLHELVPPTSRSTIEEDASFSSCPGGIRVRIVRQVQVEIGRHKKTFQETIGTSTMSPVPPVMTEANSPDEVCLDWQGEAKLDNPVTCGGFSAGGLIVKDFLVLSLTPWTGRSSFLLPSVQISQPIRFVTESWVDTDRLHPQDL